VSQVDGRSETINSLPAWVGRLQTTGQDGSPLILAAAFIQAPRRTESGGAGKMLLYQVIGKSGQPGDADEQAIFASARSFGRVTDPAALNVKPARVDVVKLTQGGSFGVVVPGLGPQAIGVDETAVLNNRQVSDALVSGSQLKIVKAGKTP
jgi:hypothetical protein